MKTLAILTALLSITSAVFAAESVQTRTVTATGPNRQTAIKNALAEAVAQVRGTEVATGDVSVGLDSGTIGLDTSDDGKTVSVDSVAIRGEGTTLKTKTAGYVKSYEVIEEAKTDDGYTVTLKVDVYAYQSPDASNRKRIAVMPLRSAREVYPFLTVGTTGPEMVKIMSFKLTSLFAETNRFTVLDRNYIEEFAAERGLMISDAAPVKEKARLGEMMGADYMLNGTIMRAEIIRLTRDVPALGRKVSEYKADIVFDYRMIVAATGQVQISDQVSISLENEEIIQLIDKRDRDDPDARKMRDKLVELAARKVVAQIVERLYPAKIVKITADGQIILNQGGKRFAKGQLYEVISQGQDLTDPDTNESLGTIETALGDIVITKVTPKIAYAAPVKPDDISKFALGMICRFKADTPEPQKPKGRTGDIKRTNSGGVKLPFD